MDCIRNEQLPELFEAIAAIMNENADHLCEMDAFMGDGDLGLTMKKGFSALPGILRETDETDLGKRLMQAGMKMTSVVPSTMGTLMGSGIMAGGKKLAGRESMDAQGLALFLSGYAEGIVKRGKCQEGDRTVLDAIAPAARAAEAHAGESLQVAAAAALKAAEDGVEATKDMLPKFGKAAVHAAKAKGVPDQGATAGMLVVKGICHYIG